MCVACFACTNTATSRNKHPFNVDLITCAFVSIQEFITPRCCRSRLYRCGPQMTSTAIQTPRAGPSVHYLCFLLVQRRKTTEVWDWRLSVSGSSKLLVNFLTLHHSVHPVFKHRRQWQKTGFFVASCSLLNRGFADVVLERLHSRLMPSLPELGLLLSSLYLSSCVGQAQGLQAILPQLQPAITIVTGCCFYWHWTSSSTLIGLQEQTSRTCYQFLLHLRRTIARRRLVVASAMALPQY